MSVFKFTTEDGQIFQIQGPAGGTYAQAKVIFDKQIATGSLTGLQTGDVVNAATQAAAGLATAQSQITTSTQLTILKLPDLTKVQVANPIDVSDFITKGASGPSIGALTPVMVRGLTAQAANAVGQPYTVITNEKGLGKYGLDSQQLESYGLLKPGTTTVVSKNTAEFVNILSSPTVWTGKQGIINLTAILNNETIQNEIQLRSMQNSYRYLQQLGLLKGTETLRELGTLVQVATKFGATLTAQWVAGKTSPNITGSINIVAKQAQYALGFSLLNSATFASNVQQAEGYTDTVNRETVQSAMSKIIGNPKVPTPTYNTPVIG
jgi:hypothetical protein